ncbi:MAG: bifunctional demethylmenaquinone methyltransferase/2-methoxy-6-polyprenyl-1,4-benzoquinol methylase UbiE [Proteobacteria bacterium]|nr:bifunctional demethylmenaquinone methyltransferase/2-methoxy-6-polyprenyl-1,4-benzoquinol methylase UbiE [Pseudomonadota bacterium]
MPDNNKIKKLDNQTSTDEIASFGYQQVPAKEKVKLVQRHFDSIAAKYDFMNSLLSFGLHYLWKRTAIKMLGLKPGDRVIDVCGGTADLAILAARYVGPGGRVMVYDFNRAMMEAGKNKVRSALLDARIKFIQGDAEQISFPDGQFDAAMVGFGIRNLTHREKGFAEMYRVLKPGGKLLCLEFSRPTAPVFRWLYDMYSFYIMPFVGKLFTGSRQAYTYLPESIRVFPSPDELSTLLETIGFTQVTYRKLTNGIAVVHLGVK